MALYPFNPNAGQTIQGAQNTVTPVDMAFLAHWQFAPANADDDGIHAYAALSGSAATLTTGITNPDFPRLITATCSGSAGAGDVGLVGTDAAGAAITDTIALNGTATVEGAKAFKTITAITLPTGAVNVKIGTANKFGMPHKIRTAACLLLKEFNSSSDAGSLAVDATDLSKNIYTLAGTPDGSKKVDLTYIV